MTDHVLDHRAKYHPVEPVETTVSHTANGKRTTIAHNRCAMHAKLWDNLSDSQQSAAEHVYRGHRATHGSLAPAVDLARLIEPKGHASHAEAVQYLKADYFAWQNECLFNAVDWRAAVIICGEGKAISEITRNRTRGARMTQDLREALDVMAKLKGWK